MSKKSSKKDDCDLTAKDILLGVYSIILFIAFICGAAEGSSSSRRYKSDCSPKSMAEIIAPTFSLGCVIFKPFKEENND